MGLLIACDPAQQVKLVNDTEQEITVSFGDAEEGVLDPGESLTLLDLEYSGGQVFQARNTEGDVVFAAELTWEELRAMDWTLVIRESTP
jgi:hypothetical protein